MKATLVKTLRPDNKGRMCFGSLIQKGVSGYHVYLKDKGCIVLEPLAEIPVKDLLATSKNKAKKQNKDLGNSKIRKKKLDETSYLLKSPENRKRLLKALKSEKSTSYKNLNDLKNAYKI